MQVIWRMDGSPALMSRVHAEAVILYEMAVAQEIESVVWRVGQLGYEAHQHYSAQDCQSLVEHWDPERCELLLKRLHGNDVRNVSRWYLNRMRKCLRERLCV